MKRLALALVVLAGAAHADTFGAHLVSVHSRPGFNNENYGLYWRSDEGLTAGFYKNSFSRTSAYAGWTWSTEGPVSFSVTAGVITGYPTHPLMPLVAPSAAFALTKSTAVRIVAIPKPPIHASAAVAHLMLEMKI